MTDFESHLRELSNTLNKDEGIVNTSSASRFLEQPEDIKTQYEAYARTHLIQPDIDRFIDNLVSALLDPDDDRSIPGYIVGPFGYGKTSTAGKVWYQLEHEENFVATPPIYFNNLQSLVDAVYGWLRFKLKNVSSDLQDRLNEVYQSKGSENIEDIFEGTSLDDETVISELRKAQQEGKADFNFTVSNVLDFLAECNNIAKEAGFDGLVVFADELQQFISGHSSDKVAYSELRDIAKSIALGLNQSDGLGLIFTMDDGLHGDLNVNADDVLARLSERNVTLDLYTVYNRSFPSELWSFLAEKYGFHDQRHEVISADALDALGEICERGPPISNGPRTVVDVLTIAIENWLSEHTTFDALDLANAYYNGIVRYKGERIRDAIGEAIDADVVNTPSRKEFIKLCGVFPRGVSDAVLDKYEVRDAKEEIKNELHGILIITHENGYTLKSLEREGEDRGVKDELFTQFYQTYDTTELYNTNAREVFREQVIGDELFPSKRGTNLDSWRKDNGFDPKTDDVYSAVFHGSFNGQRYPKRNVLIQTGPSEQAVQVDGGLPLDIDIAIGFVLDLEGDVDPQVSRPTTDQAILHLNLRTSFDSLPSNIAMLEDYMSPEDVSPHLLLSLYKFMDDWQDDNNINPNQEDQLQYISDQLITQSIQQLFGEPLNNDSFFGIESDRRRIQPQQVIQTVFNTLIEDVYPTYETFFISDNYDSFLEAYESLLLGNELELRISQKRGNSPIEAPREELAKGIGVKSLSTAKTRYQKQFKTLVDLQDWTGDIGRIELKLHPLEEALYEALNNDEEGQLSYEEAYEIGLRDGHRGKEVDWAIRLLDAREYIDRYPEDRYVELSDIAIDYDQVQEKLNETEATFERICTFDPEWELRSAVRDRIDAVRDEFQEAEREDIEVLDQVLGTLTDIESDLEKKISALQAKYEERCRNKKEDLERISRQSPPRSLSVSADGTNVPFSMYLSDAQARLTAEFDDVISKAEDVTAELSSTLQSVSNSADLDEVETLEEKAETATRVQDEIENEIEDVEAEATKYEDWCELAQDMGSVRERMVRYTQTRGDNPEIEGLIDKLNSQLEEIQQGFLEDEETMLGNAQMERRDLEEIKSRFEEITQADHDVFDYRRFVLENTVTSAAGSRIRIRQSLNPQNPQTSRSNLKEDFHRQLGETIDRISNQIQTVQNSLKYAELLDMVPADVETDPESIRSELQEADEWLKTVEAAAEDLSITEHIGLPDPDQRTEEFPETDDRLLLDLGEETSVDIGNAIADRREAVSEYDDLVKRWRQTSSDVPSDLEYIHNKLDYGATKDIEGVLIDIAEEQGDEFDVEEVFTDMKRLFEGNHITLQIKSEHRD